MLTIEDLRGRVQSRLAAGATPEALAKEIRGVTAGTVRNFARPGHGLRGPSLDALRKWAGGSSAEPSADDY